MGGALSGVPDNPESSESPSGNLLRTRFSSFRHSGGKRGHVKLEHPHHQLSPGIISRLRAPLCIGFGRVRFGRFHSWPTARKRRRDGCFIFGNNRCPEGRCGRQHARVPCDIESGRRHRERSGSGRRGSSTTNGLIAFKAGAWIFRP